MLEKCETVLLLSDVQSFCERYANLAQSVGVKLKAESTWSKVYRIDQGVVITKSSYLEYINEAYYSKIVLLLKKGESPAKFIKLGIERFIFNYENDYELLVALFRITPKVVQSKTKGIKDIVADSGTPFYCEGDYDFRFDRDLFKYKNKPIYLCESQKQFLATWLLGGHKDNSRRMILCNLRKKFGQDFLKDVNRFGQIKGGKR